MSVLKFLFETEQEFPWSWKAEIQYGDDAEGVRQLKKQLEALLSEEQIHLWEKYHAKGLQLHHLECRKDFERGFVLGVKLLMEVVDRAEHMEC